MKIRKLWLRFRKVCAEKGIWYSVYFTIKYLIKWINISLISAYYRYLNPSKTFAFQGKNLPYFYHKYNTTWRNERKVEIPIICELVKRHNGEAILEVGNVLSHYFAVNHDILDKYEKAHNVINEDVVDFKPSKKYDLIVSISTLEHVGWDEKPRSPVKILQALENLKTNCLKSGGRIIVALPLGYNSYLDKLLAESKIEFAERYYLKRFSKHNKWKQVSWDQCRDAEYDFIHHSARALVTCIDHKGGDEHAKNTIIDV